MTNPNATFVRSLRAVRRFADRVVGLSGGRVVFDGPPDALTEEALAEIYRKRTSRDERARAPEETIQEAS